MLGGELDLVGWWLVDPRGRVSVEDLRSRLSRREPFGVGAAGGLECGVSVAVDGVGVPVVHVGGRVHADAGVLEGKNPGEAVGRPSAAQAENARLKAQLRKAEVELSMTRTALEIMGKAHALLGQISESADTDPRRGKRS